MPCPYFYPERLLENWPNPPRLPLLDAWDGVCMAHVEELWCPDPATLRGSCTFGYARSICGRFPESHDADAVRFSPSTREDGLLEICVIEERGHWPGRVVRLQYLPETGGFREEHPDEIIRRQASVFVEGYLRRRAATTAGERGD